MCLSTPARTRAARPRAISTAQASRVKDNFRTRVFCGIGTSTAIFPPKRKTHSHSGEWVCGSKTLYDGNHPPEWMPLIAQQQHALEMANRIWQTLFIEWLDRNAYSRSLSISSPLTRL